MKVFHICTLQKGSVKIIYFMFQLSDWWASVAYLEFRNPVVIHVSPGIVLPKQNYTDTAGQLRYKITIYY